MQGQKGAEERAQAEEFAQKNSTMVGVRLVSWGSAERVGSPFLGPLVQRVRRQVAHETRRRVVRLHPSSIYI